MRPHVAALLLLAGALAAEDGGQAAAWTKGALGARSAALGQALGALGDDPDAALLNPALIATQTRANLGDQAALLPDGSQLHHLGWARPFWPGSRMGWSLAYAQYTVGQPLERRRGNSGHGRFLLPRRADPWPGPPHPGIERGVRRTGGRRQRHRPRGVDRSRGG